MKLYEKILIVKMSSLGDIVHALPTVVALRNAYPKAYIVWAVQKEFASFLPGKPYIDEVITINREEFFTLTYLTQLRKKLSAYHFDLLIDLQYNLKSSILSLLSGCSNRIGYCEPREGAQLVSKRVVGAHKDGNIIERYLDTVRYLGHTVNTIEFPPIPIDEKSRQKVNHLFKEEQIKGPYVVFAVATRAERKNWPITYFKEVAKFLLTKGFTILLIGTASEQSLGTQLEESLSSDMVHNIMGKTTLLELAYILEQSALYVGGDTGPTHIANALKVPLVALYGGTYPSRSGPYGNPQSRVLLSPTAPEEKGQKANDNSSIMEGLQPSLVISEIKQLLDLS